MDCGVKWKERQPLEQEVEVAPTWPHWFRGTTDVDVMTTRHWAALRSNEVVLSMVTDRLAGFDTKKEFSEWVQQQVLQSDSVFGKCPGTDEELEFVMEHADGMMHARMVVSKDCANGV
jgi:hypothetical protein